MVAAGDEAVGAVLPAELVGVAARSPVCVLPVAAGVDVPPLLPHPGSPSGLNGCVQAVRRGGGVVLLGLLPPGEVPLLGNVVVTREITLRGAFRFDTEFAEALTLLAGGLNVRPLITATLPVDTFAHAFELAGDRTRSSKVLLDFRS